MAKKPTTTETSTSKNSSSWQYPRWPLEEAISIPKALLERGGGEETRARGLASYMGMPGDAIRFRTLLSSANQYGLVTSGAARDSIVTLTTIGRDVVAPTSPDERRIALRQAFRKIPIFARIEDRYAPTALSIDEYFLNTLIKEFNLPRSRVEDFALLYKANIEFLRSFDVELRPASPDSPQKAEFTEVGSEELTRVRRYLDTCFVMMPFGEWFDKYYREIYVPAIQAASFEPKRADELFSTGSVVEQIWEEIEKSSVLLADLTGKNPNVFYELGLAHAAYKPVVFTSGNIEDVPFDLRHLRVIVYDVREPRWAENLQKSITDYLRNARHEPEKSIPQPFRGRFLQNDRQKA